MSAVRLLSPSLNLIEETISLLSDTSKDFSSSLIVFPGKRPAHVLRKKLAEKIGASFIPPKIFSIDIFIDYLCTVHCNYVAKQIEECDAVAILFELHQQLQEEQKIGKEHFGTLETFYPVGVKIYSELEELAIASISPKRLMQSVSSVTIVTAHTLALLYEPFYAELKRRGFASRAMKYQLAANRIAEIDFSKYTAIVLAGFFAFTPTEEIIVRHLLSLPNAVFLFQQGKGIRATLGKLKLNPQPEGEEPAPEHYCYESPDPHGQFFALNTVMSRLFPQPIRNSEEAAIILPSAENLFPLYHQTLSMYDRNTYNLALGYPVLRTPVYGFLMSLLDVIVTSKNNEVFVPKYVQFLLHPYTKNILFKTRTDVTRAIVHAIEDDCIKHSSRVFLKLDDVENNPALHEEIVKRLQWEKIEISSEEICAHIKKIHTSTLQLLLNISTVGEFASACINVLQFINEHSTAHRHPYFRPFVETLLEHFALLQQSLLAEYSFGKLERYLLFLRHFIESAEVPFTGTPLQGLQALGFLETRGLQFNTVFVIDANDDILPGKAQQDVLLPLALREQLGLSTYRDQEKIKAYIFDVLCKGSKSVHHFYINNNEKEPSRFIAQLQWEKQLTNKTLKQFNTQTLNYHIDLSAQTPKPVQKLPQMIAVLKAMQFSSTALDTYLTCPLQFYYRYVLGLYEKEEISGDVERSDVGKIVHKILQEYFAPAKDRKLEVRDIDAERLKKIISENFKSFYGSTQFGEQFFTRRQVEKHLLEFIEQVQKPTVQSSAVIIEALEEKFSAEIDGVQFVGNADRIETRNERTFIIDFKTGHNERNYLINTDELKVGNRETWKETIGSLQLPMYVLLYSTLRNVPPEKIVPTFVFLGKKELDESIEVTLFDSEEQMKEWFPKLKEIILSLVKEIMDMNIPFKPTSDIKNDCPSCAYHTICGTQWVEKFSLF